MVEENVGKVNGFAKLNAIVSRRLKKKSIHNTTDVHSIPLLTHWRHQPKTARWSERRMGSCMGWSFVTTLVLARSGKAIWKVV